MIKLTEIVEVENETWQGGNLGDAGDKHHSKLELRHARRCARMVTAAVLLLRRRCCFCCVAAAAAAVLLLSCCCAAA